MAENKKLVEGLGEIKPLQMILERRREAKEMGRLIHPEPLIAEIRKKRKLRIEIAERTPLMIAIQRAGDFVEGVARTIRNPQAWENVTASMMISSVIQSFIFS